MDLEPSVVTVTGADRSALLMDLTLRFGHIELVSERSVVLPGGRQGHELTVRHRPFTSELGGPLSAPPVPSPPASSLQETVAFPAVPDEPVHGEAPDLPPAESFVEGPDAAEARAQAERLVADARAEAQAALAQGRADAEQLRADAREEATRMRAAAVAERERAAAAAQADAERRIEERVETAIRERSAELEGALRDVRARWAQLSAEIEARLDALQRDVAGRLDQGAE